MEVLDFKVRRLRIDTDPFVDVFQVVITTASNNGGIWAETIPTEDGVYWFHRGLQAAYFGKMIVPLLEIPKNDIRVEIKNTDDIDP